MPHKFCPSRGVLTFFFLFVLALLSPQAADKKHKSAEAEKAKDKAKAVKKAEPKQQAKSARETRREKAEREKQLARKKKDDEDEKGKKKRGKQKEEVAKREDKKSKGRGKEEKLTKREREKQKEKEKLAKREDDKKGKKAKGQLTKHENDKKSGKKKEEVAARKAPPEKETRRSKQAKEAELAAEQEKTKSKASRQEHNAEEKRKEPARRETVVTTALLARAERKHVTEAEDEGQELSAGHFMLRPIAKAAPQADLKFNVTRATALTSFDAPPPRETGPDVIDVIEHNSPAEAKRLDELVRSDMKNPVSVAPVPGATPKKPTKKLDVKMDADRIRQIQEALAKKGYYTGEISGEYNDATKAAMQKFQEEHKVDVTGYATAQSLKLLGLTDW